jgi:hypothetical protein
MLPVGLASSAPLPGENLPPGWRLRRFPYRAGAVWHLGWNGSIYGRIVSGWQNHTKHASLT